MNALGDKRIRVLFVCRANECRSALAESCFRAALRRHGDEGRITVSSAGVRAVPGSPMHPECVAFVGGGTDHRSRALTKDMVAESDVVVTMTHAELADVLRLWPKALARAVTLSELARTATDDPLPGRHGDAAQRLRELVSATIRNRGVDSASDDIVDPAGRAVAVLRDTVAVVGACVDRLTGRLWPVDVLPAGRPA